jgi:hypothetical protein
VQAELVGEARSVAARSQCVSSASRSWRHVIVPASCQRRWNSSSAYASEPATTMKSLCSMLSLVCGRTNAWYRPILRGSCSAHSRWSLVLYAEKQSSSGLSCVSLASSAMHAKPGTAVVLARSPATMPSSCSWCSSRAHSTRSTSWLKPSVTSETTSYMTTQLNMLLGTGSTLAGSESGHVKWYPASSMFSFMWWFGSSASVVCCETCSAAWHAPRSCSVSGNVACAALQRDSMRRGLRA